MSMTIFYHVMRSFLNNDVGEDSCKEKLFKSEKFFFLVSNTPQEYVLFRKNKSNRYNNIVKPLTFLKRFEPYHYKMVFSVNERGFHDFFYKWNKKYI